MKRKIYIDFDSTLYDTNTFYKDFIKICKEQNVDEISVKKMRKELFNKDSDFNLDVLANNIYSRYNLSDAFLNKVNGLYSDKYLYKDAINFLEKIYLKYPLILLTYGNKEYQYKKIIHSNIERYFKDIIITNEFKTNLKLDFSTSIFIDNNPKEILSFYNKGARHLIRVRKENDDYSKLDISLDSVKEISSFDELKDEVFINE